MGLLAVDNGADNKVSSFVSLEPNGGQASTGASIQEMTAHLLQMEEDLKRTDQMLKTTLSLEPVLTNHSFGMM